ncbi:4157_t:CDS:2 [Acaulospora colombiana]|uniref:4157_t:CDS:1 n=1 Tax=Acaulospora colombiana TaxID=27376 RepID=A0ACA9MKB4_9GLOM|nr:4157_t:CDS:2 [Acaulospora colombiana]
MSERSYIVELLSPIFRSFRNAFPEVRYEWIEKDVKSLKEAGKMFAINVKARKTDLLIMRLSDGREILHIEVSGPPYKPEKRHTVGDAKKLLMMAVFKSYSIQNHWMLQINLWNEFIEQEELLEEISYFMPLVNDDANNLREWIHLPDDDLISVTEGK